jgi:hypothetical protein
MSTSNLPKWVTLGEAAMALNRRNPGRGRFGCQEIVKAAALNPAVHKLGSVEHDLTERVITQLIHPCAEVKVDDGTIKNPAPVVFTAPRAHPLEDGKCFESVKIECGALDRYALEFHNFPLPEAATSAAAATSTSGAEARCRAWLMQLASPDGAKDIAQHAKSFWRGQANGNPDLKGLSGRAFERAWAAVAQQYPNIANPGRRSRSRNQITAPK